MIKYTAIVPIKKLSKGLKNKNFKLLNGIPLYKYTINSALKSKIDKILITSDKDFTSIYKNERIIFDSRPEYLLKDNVDNLKVVSYILKKYSFIDNFVLLQPTSPLRTFKDINNSIEIYEKKKLKSLVSVTMVKNYPFIFNSKNDYQIIINKTFNSTNRQNYKTKAYSVNGAIYISNSNNFLKQKSFFIKNDTGYYLMPFSRSIDIDYKDDFNLVKKIIV